MPAGSLAPALRAGRWDYVVSDGVATPDCFALVREAEGWCAIRRVDGGDWALISLSAVTALELVGLTARMAGALAGAGIAANVVAGLRHDHLLVPWDRRNEALAILRGLDPVGVIKM